MGSHQSMRESRPRPRSPDSQPSVSHGTFNLPPVDSDASSYPLGTWSQSQRRRGVAWIPAAGYLERRTILFPKENGELAWTPMAPPPGQSQSVPTHTWYLPYWQQSPELVTATWAAAGATGSHRKGRPRKALNTCRLTPPGIRSQHPTDGPRPPLQLLHRRPPVQRGWPAGGSDHHPNPALLVHSPDHQLHLMENLPPAVSCHPPPPATHMRAQEFESWNVTPRNGAELY
ncbi:hypothetical protein CapIbe_001622 [Capra ibex]